MLSGLAAWEIFSPALQLSAWESLPTSKLFGNRKIMASTQTGRAQRSCKKGFHWLNECHSKFDKDGSALTTEAQQKQQGN